MVELGLYLLSVGLVVMGALGVARAFSIPAKSRMILACLFAAIPIGVGIWLFRSAGLKVTDLDRLVRAAASDVSRLKEFLQDTQSHRMEL